MNECIGNMHTDPSLESRLDFRCVGFDSDQVKEELKSTTVVFCYLLPKNNDTLRAMFEELLPAGARIVSNSFPLGTPWKPSHIEKLKDGLLSMYFYSIDDIRAT
jgi:hypothetical protein